MNLERKVHNMNILVITRSDDHEGVQLTIDAIKKSGHTPVRFDTDRFPTEIQLEMSYNNNGENLILVTPEETMNLKDIDSVYYRRVAYGNKIPLNMNKQLRNACIGETKTTIEGFITSLKAFHLDPLWVVRRASNKQLQLQLAREIGLEIPRTLITNSKKAVLDFAKTCPSGMITKMQSSFAIYEDGLEKVVFTSKVKEEDLEHLDSLNLSPMVFQELIPKKLEFRVTIVGNRIFSSAIDSQKHSVTEIDWRRDGLGLLQKWKPVDLPQEVEEKLFKLMNSLQLQYGAADLLLTPDGRYVFLEVNPAGEYFWLDEQRDIRISATLAEVLTGKNRRTF